MGNQQIKIEQDSIWDFSDEYDLLIKSKMKALGINESFLTSSSDPSKLTTSIVLSHFKENLKKLTGK